MKRLVLYFAVLCGLSSCNIHKPDDAIPVKVPEEQMALHLQFANDISRLMEEDSVRWDAVIALSDSAQAIFWYVPEVFAAEAFAWSHLGDKAKSDSILIHMRNLYDRRLRQRADFSDALNRAFVSGFLYGSETLMAELDSLAKLKVYQPNSKELDDWRKIGAEALEQILEAR